MLYLVRHGMTSWNRNGLFRGRHDMPLSEEGRKQAAKTAAVLRRHQIRFLFSSPLRRALDTASIIAKESSLAVNVLEGLADVDFGDWEGRTVHEVSSQYAEMYHTYRQHPEHASFPGGETLNGCLERVIRTFHGITNHVDASGGEPMSVDAGSSADAVIVTHRVVLKLIILGILGLSTAAFWKVRLDTCSISLVSQHDGLFTVTKLNETCHLGEPGNVLSDF
jgi:probable phosphoglycerate mutase